VRFIETGSIRICVDVEGSGPNLLFVGGTGWDLRLQPNPLTSPLVAHFTVALYDQRGMGQTDKPPGPYQMSDYAGDAVALMDALGWNRAHLVGYSFGGMVAQELAINFPGRFDRIVLAASAPGGAGGCSYPIEEFLDLDPEDRARRGLEIADTRFTPAFQRQNPDLARQMVEKRMRGQTAFAKEDGALDGLRAQLAARAQHDCYDRLPRIVSDTLILAGTFDGQAEMSAQRKMAGQIARAQFAEVAGSHSFLFESDEAYEKMIDFLSAGRNR
jgi:3-oxoadipate enol-lactonase